LDQQLIFLPHVGSNDQSKLDTNQEVVEPTVIEEAVLEEAVVEEVISEKSASEDKPEQVETSSKKTIKDYLSKDLFAGIKVISDKEDQVEIEKLADDILDEYQGTFNDISENQIISAKVIGISDNDVMVDIGFKSED
jgi:small subunit ribosomal protein S1